MFLIHLIGAILVFANHSSFLPQACAQQLLPASQSRQFRLQNGELTLGATALINGPHLGTGTAIRLTHETPRTPRGGGLRSEVTLGAVRDSQGALRPVGLLQAGISGGPEGVPHLGVGATVRATPQVIHGGPCFGATILNTTTTTSTSTTGCLDIFNIHYDQVNDITSLAMGASIATRKDIGDAVTIEAELEAALLPEGNRSAVATQEINPTSGRSMSRDVVTSLRTRLPGTYIAARGAITVRLGDQAQLRLEGICENTQHFLWEQNRGDVSEDRAQNISTVGMTGMLSASGAF